MAFFLQRQRLIEHEATCPSEAAHITLLAAVGHEFVFVGLASLHG
jgi:hypothetical protein